MKQSKTAAIESIANIESFILNTKNLSPASLSSDLHQLRDFRKDTYNDYANSHNSDTGLLFDEYDRYCNFVLELLTEKQIPTTMWSQILVNFVNEYDFIKPFDNNRSAYNSTLKSLDYLTKHPKFAGENTGSYHLKNIYSLTNQFIYNQNNAQQLNQE